MPRKIKKVQLTLDFLQEHGLLIGSRALGVESTYSDMDFVILAEHLNKIEFEDADIHDLTTYFRYLPADDTGEVAYKYRTADNYIVDIVIFEKPEHVETARQAVEAIKAIPKYMLEAKEIRVECYQKALEHYGFKFNSYAGALRPDNMSREEWDFVTTDAEPAPTPMSVEDVRRLRERDRRTRYGRSFGRMDSGGGLSVSDDLIDSLQELRYMAPPVVPSLRATPRARTHRNPVSEIVLPTPGADTFFDTDEIAF